MHMSVRSRRLATAAVSIAGSASCLAQAPSAGNVAWIPIEKYPAAAVSSHQEGISQAKLTQDANGTITDCLLIVSSGHKALDEASCPLIKGARMSLGDYFEDQLQFYWYLPSRVQANTYGGAIPISPTWWIVTDDYPSVPELRKGHRGTVSISYEITENGRATNCQGQSLDGGQQLAVEICELFERRARFISAVGPDGPIKTMGSSTLRFINGAG